MLEAHHPAAYLFITETHKKRDAGHSHALHHWISIKMGNVEFLYLVWTTKKLDFSQNFFVSLILITFEPFTSSIE